jgi:hypothetical protein
MNGNFYYTIIGVIIGGLITLAFNWISKYYEEKKSFREIIIKAALENWKASIDINKYNTDKTGIDSKIFPLEDFIIHAKLFSDLINTKEIKEKDIDKFLQKWKKIDKYLDNKREELNNKNNEIRKCNL